MNLVELPIANGILRVDRNISTENVEMRLGHYGLPEFEMPIQTTKKKVGDYEATIIDNGKYQLAIVPLKGWENTSVVSCYGLHPESQKSTTLTLSSKYLSNNSNSYYACLMLWNKSGEEWTEDSLMPVEKLNAEEDFIQIGFKDGSSYSINY